MYRPRWIEETLRGRTERHRVVVVTGARQTGKTTLLRRLFRSPEWLYLTLDDLDVLDAARTAPADLVARGRRLVIDEVQRAPGLLLAIKHAVDMDPERRFVLSGSANMLLMKGVSESLAGRAAYTTLAPMTLGEATGVPRSGLWDALMNPDRVRDLLAWIGGGRDLGAEAPSGTPLGPVTAHGRTAFLEEVWRGGFPALLGHGNDMVVEWFDGFERTYLERDVLGSGGVSDVVPFRRAVRVAALQAGGLLNLAEVARAVALSAPTVGRYLDVLEVVMMCRRVAPVAASRRKRLVRTPKLYLTDSGLHAHICGIRSAGELAASPVLGAAIETWTMQQLDVAASLMRPAAEVSYWRTADGYEVDFVLEQGERMIGIEVKAGAAHARSDLRGLTVLREEAGDRFVLGILLHGGSKAEVLGDRLVALPALYAGI